MVVGSELDPRIFDENVKGFAKATNFNAKFELKAAALSEMEFLVEREKRKLETKKKNMQAVSTLAFENDFNDTPYLSMLERGTELADVMEMLSADIHKEKQKKEEQARKQEEDQLKAQLGEMYHQETPQEVKEHVRTHKH